MATATPFQAVELEEALRKITKRAPITRNERELVQRTLDETPCVESDEQEVRRLLGLGSGQPLPPEILDELAFREANRDHEDPVLRAIARAPVDDQSLPPELCVELGRRRDALRTGRLQPIPHQELEHELARRRETESSSR